MTGSGVSKRKRVLLIGLDSADADLIEQWAAAGYLPTFARLRRDGVWGRLGTSAEVMHVSAWPTLYTGTTPGHHGMYHAYQVRAGDQRVHRTEPQWCGQPPFWKFLDDADRKCIVFDAFMDYLLPTSIECPDWELGETVTPSPHHPIGAKGVGESATVGSPAAVVNAVIDAISPFGVRHADMPLTPANVWRAIQGNNVRVDMAVE